MLAIITPLPSQGEPGSPDNSLPGIPGYPSNALPGGGHVDNGLPGGGTIDNSLPGHRPILIPPATLPVLPGIWPKPGMPSLTPPVYPSQPIVIPGIDNSLPELPPDTVIWPPLPPSSTGKYAILVWVLGVGYRWVIVEGPDAGRPDHGLPKPPVRPDHGLPPTPQPK